MQIFAHLPTKFLPLSPIHFLTKSNANTHSSALRALCRRRQKAPPPPAAGAEAIMASNQHCLYLALLFLFIAFTYSSSPFLSYDALKAGKSTGRSLLQAQKNCPVDMEGQNYTIITSKCKGPKYPAAVCCEALLEFCCGFVDELNDMTNNCADTMFSYINLYGQYPSGLFANQCKEGKEGLSCDKVLKAKQEKGEIKSSAAAASAPPRTQTRLRSLVLALALAFLLYLLF